MEMIDAATLMDLPKEAKRPMEVLSEATNTVCYIKRWLSRPLRAPRGWFRTRTSVVGETFLLCDPPFI